MTALLQRELAPLRGDGLSPVFSTPTEEEARTLGATLAGMALSSTGSAQLEIVMPGIAGWLVGSTASSPSDERHREERLAALGDRHPLIGALLSGYDQSLRGQPVRAVNRQASLWQLLWRHLRGWRVRRVVGFAVEPLMSLGLRGEAAELDDELLRELGRVVVERGEVVKGSAKLTELVAEARRRLEREPEEPGGPVEPNLDAFLSEAQAVAEDLDTRAAVFDLEALLVLRPRGLMPSPVRVVMVEPEVAEEAGASQHASADGERSPAVTSAPPDAVDEGQGLRRTPPDSRLPWSCRRCDGAARLRTALNLFRVTLERDLANLLPRDGPAAVPT